MRRRAVCVAGLRCARLGRSNLPTGAGARIESGRASRTLHGYQFKGVMMLTKILSAGALALTVASPAWAEIVVTDAYARSTMPGAPTGAAFMVIGNTGETDDRLVEVLSDVAERVELHTHRAEGDGVVRMVHVEEGIVIPAGGQHALQRGGDHVMMMGLTRDLKQGDTFALTLVFENAGERKIEVPVDLKRVADHSGMAHD
ncbi:hypothetical protein SAMN05444340_11688 [Citreimonas salinaria]|uniref:Copper(I)-binding protein n=2 Tax=Citreimonas salinaria TaxID=321339 RepID=A0A1H3MBZ1_9RHOB|nr:hypothetical protein SAMN05444340_11688 [Citreimonas salinaria]